MTKTKKKMESKVCRALMVELLKPVPSEARARPVPMHAPCRYRPGLMHHHLAMALNSCSLPLALYEMATATAAEPGDPNGWLDFT